jgi:hypothetical protein
MGNKKKFLDYLEELENQVPADVLENARQLYEVN